MDLAALDYDEVLILAEVHEIVDQFVRAVDGPLPALGSAAWRVAEPAARIAALLVLAEAWLVEDPERRAAEQLKAASAAIAAGMDWSKFANEPSRSELAKRRAQCVTPVRCTHPGCPTVVSVAHPLPDLSTVLCDEHHKKAAAA